MKIKVLGAAGGEVTGSAYLVQTDKAAVLIDAGMFQGGKRSQKKNKLPEGATPDKIDAILLTHGHLDHTGRVASCPGRQHQSPTRTLSHPPARRAVRGAWRASG